MTAYVPASVAGLVRNFVAYSHTGGVAALQTALRSAFAGAGTIQCFADGTSGLTNNALIVVNDMVVFSVADGMNITWYNGTWSQASADDLADDTLWLAYTAPS